MTAIATVSSTYKLTLFYLIAPASGNNTLQLSWDGAATRLVLSSVSYTGAKQSSQPDAFNTGTDTTSPFQVSVTTVADNCWTVGAFVDNTDAVMTVGTGTTNRAGSGAVSDVLADSNAAKTPAGSVTLECTGAGGGGLQIGASFKPYVAPTSSAFLLF